MITKSKKAIRQLLEMEENISKIANAAQIGEDERGPELSLSIQIKRAFDPYYLLQTGLVGKESTE